MMTYYDWHDSTCAGGTWTFPDAEPVTEPCDCEMPRLFRSAYQDGVAAARAALTAKAIRDALVVLPPPKDFRSYATAVRSRLLALLAEAKP